jgi:hypothetical protein
MSLVDLRITPFTVAGRINSAEFQKAKAIAENCEASASVTVLPLMPTEYDKLMLQLQEEVRAGPLKRRFLLPSLQKEDGPPPFLFRHR